MLPKLCRRPGFHFIPLFGVIFLGNILPIHSAGAAESSIIGALPGEQMAPAVSLGKSGGFVVWEDNSIEATHKGWGIGVRQLDANGSAVSSNQVANSLRLGDQTAPQVAAMEDGSGVIVWQGSAKAGAENIYLRVASPAGKLLGTDITVNADRKGPKSAPAVAVSGNQVMVVWQSFGQDGSQWGVYGQRFLTSPLRRLGSEFQVNQFSNFNQSMPAVAATPGGGFVVAWVSEQQRVRLPTLTMNQATLSSSGRVSVDIYARIFGSDGAPAGDEFLVNGNDSLCAMPTIAVSAGGSFLVGWAGREAKGGQNGFDVYGRTFSAAGVASSDVARINSYLPGAQYQPKVATDGTRYLVVWTSNDQDGSKEGCYGRFVNADGTVSGDEIQLNTTTVSIQKNPAVAASVGGQFLTIWTGFVRGTHFDLFANTLP